MVVAATILSAAQAADAQSIRYFVRQSSGLFEVKSTPASGGRFVVAPTGEWIAIPGLGSLPVRGYTDRAMRGETVIARGEGSGRAKFTVTRTNQAGHVFLVFSREGTLPTITPPFVVSLDPNWDNLTGAITPQYGKIPPPRRLPIGTRPN